jgi:hypothetical protein
MEEVMGIESVNVRPVGNGRYSVRAVGTVPTAGWSKAALVSRTGFVSSEGTLDYYLMAEKPTGRPLQVISKVHAEAVFGGPGTDLKGLHTVRVFDRDDRSYDVPFPP